MDTIGYGDTNDLVMVTLDEAAQLAAQGAIVIDPDTGIADLSILVPALDAIRNP